jgi:hypothetical protein
MLTEITRWIRGEDLVSSSRSRRTEPGPRHRRDDPVEFIEAVLRNYPKGQWIVRERERLTNTIESIEREEENR